ncbi:hypothetical protein M413DRAFT_445256 [Hebeloma cylindrosporum]|uniref:Aminoglycoside phosphotransferase domain-containing protein n=1 Tax=Hebeloma cylindrosporum TaxID=76867 RepID=A0A0C3BXC0_HEBCY|nr:hypothetical protein M413DRAFT_445256 [Hebeloma cylindrosporum h7]
MQQYVFNGAEGDLNAPRVPKIHDFFISDNWMGYLVMEYIQASPTHPEDVPEKVASALQWLRDLPPPSDTAIGSVAGPGVPYMLLKGLKAPIAFSSIEAIERYMNTALSRLPRRSRAKSKPITFSNEKFLFTQTDMHEGNFFLDMEEKMCLIDFDGVALLPESFGNQFLASRMNFVQKVAAHLNWPTHNVESMGKAQVIIQMTGNKSLGLDENGFRKPRTLLP